MKVVLFEVGSGLYAFGIQEVSEIIRSETYTTSVVPMANSAFKGTAIIRGKVCNIISLSDVLAKSGKAAEDVKIENTILIDSNIGYFGLEVGAVKNIEEYGDDDIDELHNLMKSDIVVSLLKGDNKIVCLLDMERILTSISNTHEIERG